MHSLYAQMLFVGFVAAIAVISWSALAQRITSPKTLDHTAPPPSFFDNCVFVCIDIQEGGEGPVTSIPEGWKEIGYTIEDCQAAADFLCKVTKPNARQVADACRALELPMIFIHWGCLFEDGMDLDPRIRRGWAEDKTVKLENVVPHISKPSSQPDKCLGIRDGEYVLAKSAQDAFPSCNIGYILENLEAKNIVFVGGHTNPGGCLGQTAKSARERGYIILCIEDATFDAGESTRIPGIAAVPFHYVMKTREFVKLAKEAQATQRSSMRYILINRQMPGGTWNQSNPDSIREEDFAEIKGKLNVKSSGIRIGVGIVISYLNSKPETLKATLERFLNLAEKTDTPVLVQLEGENWWGARPDLWNWWDPERPGYNPDNKENVEWTGWSSDQAVKIGWRNWGRQIRVLPQPNLMSPRYRKACHEMLALLVPIVLDWWSNLPNSKKELLVGIKVGHESSIGVNAFYYPDGNALLDRASSDDPTTGINASNVPSRGVAQIGYAAVKTAGIRSEGEITEEDLAEVVRRHLENICRALADMGVPRDKLYTHCAGWRDGELLYESALNQFSCPGWSFYRHAGDPRVDMGVQNALSKTNAPFWGAVEWLYQGPREVEAWRSAIGNTLTDPRCRFICIYNWEGIRESEAILEAIKQIVSEAE